MPPSQISGLDQTISTRGSKRKRPNVEPVYEVEEILNHQKNVSGEYEFLVSWKGYSENVNS